MIVRWTWLALASGMVMTLGCSSGDEGASSSPSDGGLEGERVDAGPQEDGGAVREVVDASADTALSPPPPPPPSFPEVVNSGGQVIKTPRVVPIVFANDPMQAQIEAFSTSLASSQYWSAIGAEYDVGPITLAPTVVIDETPGPTLTNDQIRAWATAKLSGLSPAFGKPDPHTLYAIFYPQAVTVAGMQPDGGTRCATSIAYHGELVLDSMSVGYAVFPRCKGLDELSQAAVHEYFEWATDPRIETAPAFHSVDDAHWAWNVTMFGELGDLCSYMDYRTYKPAKDGLDWDYVAQRFWSNSRSRKGLFPCSPSSNLPYAQAVIQAKDKITVGSFAHLGTKVAIDGIVLKAGETKDFDVVVYADRPNTDVRLSAFNRLAFQGESTASTGYEYELSNVSASGGDTVHITITAPKTPAFDVVSVLADTGVNRGIWSVLVINDPTYRNGALDPNEAADPNTAPDPDRARIEWARALTSRGLTLPAWLRATGASRLDVERGVIGALMHAGAPVVAFDNVLVDAH